MKKDDFPTIFIHFYPVMTVYICSADLQIFDFQILDSLNMTVESNSRFLISSGLCGFISLDFSH